MTVHRRLSSFQVPRGSVETGAPRRDWKPVPHINQLHPNGASRGYVNGPYNCGPAVVAMLARGWGKLSEQGDAELIRNLSRGLVGPGGTSAQGITTMLERASVHLGGKVMGGAYDEGVLQRQLKRGHMLIAQVKADGPSKTQGSAHYILVRQLTADGNYLISDPLAKKPYVVRPDQLRQAVTQAPPDGGLLIPIARPGGSEDRAAPPAQTYEAPGAPSRGRDAAPVNPRPFFASERLFEGVDTRFHDTRRMALFGQDMLENQKRNNFKLDYSYRPNPYDEAASNDGRTHSHTPGRMSAQEFARALRGLRERGDPRANTLLALMEDSRFDKDRLVLELIREMDLKDRGIGRKPATQSFGD